MAAMEPSGEGELARFFGLRPKSISDRCPQGRRDLLLPGGRLAKLVLPDFLRRAAHLLADGQATGLVEQLARLSGTHRLQQPIEPVGQFELPVGRGGQFGGVARRYIGRIERQGAAAHLARAAGQRLLVAAQPLQVASASDRFGPIDSTRPATAARPARTLSCCRRPARSDERHALRSVALGSSRSILCRLHRGQQFVAQRGSTSRSSRSIPSATAATGCDRLAPATPLPAISADKVRSWRRHAVGAAGERFVDLQLPSLGRFQIAEVGRPDLPRIAEAAVDRADLLPARPLLRNSRSSSAARRLCRAASRSRSSSGASTVSRRGSLLPTWSW